jgi:hypothetical protein
MSMMMISGLIVVAATADVRMERGGQAARCRQYRRGDAGLGRRQEAAGIHDPAHVAYPAAAKGKIERRDNLMRFIDALKRQLPGAKAALDWHDPTGGA